jgi:hypothetical protein
VRFKGNKKQRGIVLGLSGWHRTWIFLALGIAIGLVASAAWVTHWIWLFRSFGLFRALRSFGKDNVVRFARTGSATSWA